MSPDKSPQNLFNEALERQDAAERARFLDAACGADTALRERVEQLLRAHDEAGGFFSQPSKVSPSAPASGTKVLPLTEKPGDWIGRYKLLQQIGEGGCGVVYMAEQEEPVRRRVALKVIKLGMDTKQVIARFEAERQALAMMDHPNIARVLDAGATDSGRPFFVMELVRGTKITEFCDEKELSTPERLDLFLKVCSAIQHAHQKGVIHRDVKPSNILVTVVDGVAVPKVIDFGIAKATNNQPLTDKTLFTAFEQFIGTPAYMSPEQAELSGVDIDTRTDIYSLGVVLYELLTGGPPFDQKKLLAAGLDAMRRTIREEEPPRPSNRLSTLTAEELTTTAQCRHTNPPKLIHEVRGDLDWIALKCLEKDRARRYETANALAMDIRRHLDNEPVVARPHSKVYEFQKTVRRHKFGFAAAAAVILALAIGLSVSTWQFALKNRAYQRATAAEHEQSRLRQQAETEAAKSRQVAMFLEDMLKGVGPSVALGRDTTLLREILDQTAQRIGKDLANQPEVELKLRGTLAEIYIELALFKPAEAMARETLRLARSRFGQEHLAVADALQRLGEVLAQNWQLDEAESVCRGALTMKRKLLGHEHPSVAESLSRLAFVMRRRGSLAEAEPMQREALALQKKLLGHDCQTVAESLYLLALLLGNLHKEAEAESAYREALAVQRKLLGNEHPEVADTLAGLAGTLAREGKVAEAEAAFREALAIERKLLGEEHQDVAESVNGLADLLESQGKSLEVQTLYREHFESLRDQLPGDDPAIAAALVTRAAALLTYEEFADAESLLREGLTIREKKLPGEWQTFNVQSMLGGALLGQSKYAEAKPLLLSGFQGIKQCVDNLPAVPDSILMRITEALRRLIQLYEATGRPDQTVHWKTEATHWYRKQAEQYRKAAAAGNAKGMRELAWLLATCDDPEIRDGRSAITFAEKAVAAAGGRDPVALDTLAAAYAETGEFARAVTIQKEAINSSEEEIAMKGFRARLKLYEANTPYRQHKATSRYTLGGLRSQNW